MLYNVILACDPTVSDTQFKQCSWHWQPGASQAQVYNSEGTSVMYVVTLCMT